MTKGEGILNRYFYWQWLFLANAICDEQLLIIKK
jgi:hypothetical protein